MKDAVSVDQPHGQRWEVALDLLSNGPFALVALGPALLLSRETGDPTSAGRICIDVVSDSRGRESRLVAQAQVDHCRSAIAKIAEDDPRFGSLLARCGVVWSYVEDVYTTRITLAEIDSDGALLWSDQ
jgi:hypothetical protein